MSTQPGANPGGNPFLGGLGAVWGSLTTGVSTVIDGVTSGLSNWYNQAPAYMVPPANNYPTQPTPNQTPAPPPGSGTIIVPGQQDNTFLYIGAGAVGLVVLAVLMGGKR